MRVDPPSESANVQVDSDFEVYLLVESGRPPTVVVRGEIDRATVGRFEAALEEAIRAGSHIEVDMGGLTFLDSAGLRALHTAQLRLGQCQEALVLRDPSPAILRVVRVFGLEELLTIRSSRPCRSDGPAPRPTRPGGT